MISTTSESEVNKYKALHTDKQCPISVLNELLKNVLIMDGSPDNGKQSLTFL